MFSFYFHNTSTLGWVHVILHVYALLLVWDVIVLLNILCIDSLWLHNYFQVFAYLGLQFVLDHVVETLGILIEYLPYVLIEIEKLVFKFILYICERRSFWISFEVSQDRLMVYSRYQAFLHEKLEVILFLYEVLCMVFWITAFRFNCFVLHLRFFIHWNGDLEQRLGWLRFFLLLQLGQQILILMIKRMQVGHRWLLIIFSLGCALPLSWLWLNHTIVFLDQIALSTSLMSICLYQLQLLLQL